jgi:alkyl hydroperoxide reductase subunit AhpC
MDKKHAKKIKRNKKKKKEKKLAADQQQRLSKQMNMFDRMPDVCSVCKSGFPKTREAHMSWKVVVRNEEQQVRLFCPSCQDKASKLMEKRDAAEQEAEEVT